MATDPLWWLRGTAGIKLLITSRVAYISSWFEAKGYISRFLSSGVDADACAVLSLLHLAA